jgi:hypothetical protein
LVVNRREDGASQHESSNDPEEGQGKISVGRRRRRDSIESDEFEISIRVSYRTLALVFFIFNILGRIVDHLSGKDLSGLSEKLTWLFPF